MNNELQKILCILQYGLIFQDHVFKVCSFYYDEYWHDYLFECDDNTIFFLTDLDVLYIANFVNL